MNVLAIDPGTTESAWCGLCNGVPTEFGKLGNREILLSVCGLSGFYDHLAIEMVASYGMPVGAEVFQTVLWAGRFIERFDGPHTLVYRKDVKLHLCQSPRANDATIRQALIDRFGGKEAAIGRKATPGPLYGIKGDVWSALAVGLTWRETA